MLTIIKGRGSECLAAAASLKYCMSMLGDCFHRPTNIAQLGRATDQGSVSRRFESCYSLNVLPMCG
jgi:hypothetical protein